MICSSGAKKPMAPTKVDAREPSRATNTVMPPRARAMSLITRASKPSGAPDSSKAPGAFAASLKSLVEVRRLLQEISRPARPEGGRREYGSTVRRRMRGGPAAIPRSRRKHHGRAVREGARTAPVPVSTSTRHVRPRRDPESGRPRGNRDAKRGSGPVPHPSPSASLRRACPRSVQASAVSRK